MFDALHLAWLGRGLRRARRTAAEARARRAALLAVEARSPEAPDVRESILEATRRWHAAESTAFALELDVARIVGRRDAARVQAGEPTPRRSQPARTWTPLVRPEPTR